MSNGCGQDRAVVSANFAEAHAPLDPSTVEGLAYAPGARGQADSATAAGTLRPLEAVLFA